MKALCSVELRVSIDVGCFRYSIAVGLSYGQLLIWIAFEPALLNRHL
jgi:hypothetical protein